MIFDQIADWLHQADQFMGRLGFLTTAEREAIAHSALYGYQEPEWTEPDQPSLPAASPVLLPTSNASIEILDWQEALDAGVGFIIAGNSGSGKTSVAVWLAAQICAQVPQKVFALDPHYNDTWGDYGIRSVGGIREIEACLNALMAELDARCDRKGKRQPLGEPMLIFCDEINACLERFNEPKTVSKALKRLGSEGRKFGLTLVAINQSANVDAIGIDANYRSNYVLICLNAAAHKIARNWKDSDPRKQYVLSTAYPCIISGAICDAIAIHPTHGSYSQFKIKGNRPLNLTPINQVPGQIPFIDGNLLPPAVEVQPLPAEDPDLADWQALQRCTTLRDFANYMGKSYTGGAVSDRARFLKNKYSKGVNNA